MGFDRTWRLDAAKEGYCYYVPCENHNYLTACGQLSKYKPEKNGKCTVCGKPIQEKEWRPE